MRDKVSFDKRSIAYREAFLSANFLRGGSFHSFPRVKYNMENEDALFSQKDIINSILSGKDTLCVMPTGGGKSLCFQAPAVFFEGITLVVTPLVSLIEDQVNKFNAKYEKPMSPNGNGESGIRYRAIHAGTTSSLRKMFDLIVYSCMDTDVDNHGEQTEQEPKPLVKTQYKLLYVSPERLTHPKFLRLLSEYENRQKHPLKISHIVLDEAHCLSQWGFQFRESYLNIRRFILEHRDRAVISAFTATATSQDIKQIKLVLEMKKSQDFISFQKRAELYPVVLPCREEGASAPKDEDSDPLRITRLIKLLKDFLRTSDYTDENGNKIHSHDKCIVYCTTVKNVEFLYEKLKEYGFEGQITRYHAELNTYIRRRNADHFGELFKANRKRIIIATKAFGMGIDDDRVRLIIHYDMPRSLEDYYQEIGRGGRDCRKTPAACVLFYTQGLITSNPGSLMHMIDWVLHADEAGTDRLMPVASRFSAKTQLMAYYHSYRRLAQMYEYCENMLEHKLYFNYKFFCRQIIDKGAKSIAKDHPMITAADDALERIVDYFTEKKENQDLSCLDRLTGFIVSHSSKDTVELLLAQKKLFYSYDVPDFNTDEELLKILRMPNELHINNTGLANRLRWHPESYELNPVKEQELVLQEYKRAGLEDGFSTILPVHVQHDSAFLHVDHLFTNDYHSTALKRDEYGAIEVLSRINTAWKQRGHGKEKAVLPKAKYLYAVNPETQVIEEVFVWDKKKGEWAAPKKADEADLETWIRKRVIDGKLQRPSISTTALFSASGHKKWRSFKRLPEISELQQINTSAYFVYAEGKRVENVKFALYGKEKLTYFDMCVLDAVYSLIQNGQQIIYLRNVWSMLTGNPEIRFPRSQQTSKAASMILESLERMMELKITIRHGSFQIFKEQFLPLKKRQHDKGELGFDCRKEQAPGLVRDLVIIPPLYRYAQELNGQIIRLSAKLMDVKTIGLNYSIYRSVMCHYLLHRIAIARKTRRGRHISFSTMENILKPYALEQSEEMGTWLRRGIKGDETRYLREMILWLGYLSKCGYMSFYMYHKDIPVIFTEAFDLNIFQRDPDCTSADYEADMQQHFSSVMYIETYYHLFGLERTCALQPFVDLNQTKLPLGFLAAYRRNLRSWKNESSRLNQEIENANKTLDAYENAPESEKLAKLKSEKISELESLQDKKKHLDLKIAYAEQFKAVTIAEETFDNPELDLTKGDGILVITK